MCGIAGYLLPRHGPAPEPWLLAGMIRQLAHRGPDGEGTWSSPDGRVGLGHRLLAIMDPTPAARQPMVSPSGRFVLSWNGELYNAPDWRADFERDGARFRSSSDAEVFLRAVATWGLDTALERATGMFAFALWDSRDGVLHLTRDRFGEKPLYYGFWQGGWYFASELKAFLPLAGWPPPLDEQALRQYLAFGRIDSPACIFQGFAKLPPGTTLSLPWASATSPSGPAPRRYWQAPARCPDVGRFSLTDGEVLEQTRELLERSVRMRLAARVPVGAFLSGGIDSSLLTALAVRHAGPGFRTYAIGFADPAFDESTPAAAVARHLGTTHRTVMLGPRELGEAVAALPDTFDEPFADSSQIPQMVLASLARQEVTVCLAGDGADELFGGYTRHVQGPATAALIGLLPPGARALLRRCLLVPSVGAWEPLSWLASWLGIGAGGWRYLGLKVQRLAEALLADSPAELYQVLAEMGWPATLVNRPAAGALQGPAGGSFSGRGAGDRPAGLPGPDRDDAGFLADCLQCDRERYLPEDILVKVDRSSMRVALETRLPFLDHALAEWACRLPASFLVGGGQGKRVLREVLRPLLPEPLWNRPKAGLTLPLRDLLRGGLREWAVGRLRSPAIRDLGLVSQARLEHLWWEHQTGHRDRNYALWTTLVLAAWLEIPWGRRSAGLRVALAGGGPSLAVPSARP